MALTALLLVLVLGIAGAGFAPDFIKGQSARVQAELMADFTAGQGHFEAGKRHLEVATTSNDLAALELARTDFLAARTDFSRARWALTINGFDVVAHFPAASNSQLQVKARSAIGLTDMASSLVAAALEAVNADLLFLKPPAAGSTTTRILEILRLEQLELAPLRSNLENAKAAAANVDLSVIPEPQRATLATAMASIGKGIAGIEQLAALIPALLEILGGNGPRTYLIEQVNPAELRAGGGFMGTYSFLRADQGKLDLVKSGPIDELDYPRPNRGEPGYIAPPPPMQEFVEDKSWVLGDSNFYPDFPTSAKYGEQFAAKEARITPNGVISIDPYATADVLEVTGPITMPEFDTTVMASGFVANLFKLEAGDKRPGNRKVFLGALAKALFARIAEMPASRWPGLLTALNKTATARHLQVYFNSPAAEKEMVHYGWSGTQRPVAGKDFLMEIESNFGGTKANFFVERRFDVTYSKVGERLHTVVVVNLKDATPDGYSGRSYRSYVRLYVPAGAVNLVASNLFPDKLKPDEREPGLEMLDGWLQINVDPRLGYGTWRMAFSFDQAWTANPAGQHVVYWQKQAGTNGDAVHVSWNADGHRFETSGDLGADRLVTLAAGGVTLTAGQAGSAALPSIHL